MEKLLLKNIRFLWSVYEEVPAPLKGKALGEVPCIENAWLACQDGKIVDFGGMTDFPGITDWKDLTVIDCTDKSVFPCFVDSHTHLVFAGNREQEFADRLRGLSYEEVAARGGGILNSVQKLRSCSEDDLYEQALVRFREIIRQGTGAVEIKSGYGLDLESELKMLRVIRRLKNLDLIPVKATLLAAHALPVEFTGNREGYIDHIIREILPAVAKEQLADFIDIFCEKNYFTAADTRRILEAGAKSGLRGKVHAEQLSHSGGIRAGVAAGAISVDHLEYCNAEDIKALKSSSTIPTILPGAAFFLDLPRPPAREMIDQGLPVAIASDYNPGSSPTGNMKLMMSIACVQYRLTTEEAFNAGTINGAWALGIGKECGCIAPGMLANFIVTDQSALSSLAYAFGSELNGEVYIQGKEA